MKSLRWSDSVSLGTLLLFLTLPVFPAELNTMGSRQVKKLFKNPPREYSTGPLWVWNDRLTDDQIRQTLRDLAGQQVKQVWVHPRPGLMTPYLSPEWFHLWQVALSEAKRLDMNVWIYDENSYPSGFAGGLVPDAMPEARGRGLLFREAKHTPTWTNSIVAVYRVQGSSAEDVTAKVRAGAVLPEDSYLTVTEARAADSPWTGNRCYVNLLSPGVTEKFLDLTFEPYRREVGAQFGRRIPGVFTDEPNIHPAGTLPWSESLLAAFRQRWGYDLRDGLPSLVQPIGDWRKLRYHYFQVLNDQFIKHWSMPYHDYCQSNHLEWTGHYWDHDWPTCIGVPDNMAMYAWHQRPAIDCLMNQYAENTHAQFGNVRMVRELSSIANQLGMQRTLCEVYGAGGWDLRFEDMKRIGDWLEVLGVNTLNQHLSYVTLRGARKRDHPQSFSYHEPWWDAYHVSAGYLARLSAALSQGEQVNHVLVLEPTTTAWMYQGDAKQLNSLGDSFFNLLMSLESAQVEYDIGCEDVMARHGSARGALLQIGRRAYSTVVLPPSTETLNAKTMALLASFLRAGGSVLSCGDPPARIDGAVSDQGALLSRSEGWKRIELSALEPHLAPRDLHRFDGDRGTLFHQRRHLADGELLFLVNTSLKFRSTGKIDSELGGAEQWDPYTGKFDPAVFVANGKGVSLDFELPPSGSLLLFLSKTPRKPAPRTEELVRVITPERAPRVARTGPNVLTLDYVDVTVKGETRTNQYFYPANRLIWQKHGLERNPWDSAVQFKDELISKTFPPDSGFTAQYRFFIEGAVPAGLAAAIERPDLYAVTCNGRLLQGKPNDWWLDRAFGRLDLASVAHSGENVITLQAKPFTMLHELEPAYVLGEFTLGAIDKGFVVKADQPLQLLTNAALLLNTNVPEAALPYKDPRGWNSQGLPFYSGGVAYRESFEIEKRKGRYLVALTDWRGSVARISVNGKPAGYIDAPPWERDVTRWLTPGRNEIEVTVVGTLKNTLGPHHGEPALGAAWPSAFQTGPNPGPPPGAAYSTVAYGLFAPFVLKQVTRP